MTTIEDTEDAKLVATVRKAIESHCLEVGFKLRKPAGDKLARAAITALKSNTRIAELEVVRGLRKAADICELDANPTARHQAIAIDAAIAFLTKGTPS